MTDDGDESIGGLFAERFGPSGGILLWQRDPKRKLDGNYFNVVTDAKDNDRLDISPQQALLLLAYLTRNKARFEQTIVEEALKRASG
jgi:hypothetical protein